MVCAWIFKSVHSSIAQSIMHLDRADDVWGDLRRRFSQRDAQRISILQSEIHNLRQGSLSVNEYYTKCRTLWEEMNTLRPIPLCKCTPRCSCDLVETIRKEKEIDQVILFLQGLNEDYNNLKSTVIVLDPLPEVYKVFVMSEKLERQIMASHLNLGNLDIKQSNAVQTCENEDTVAALNFYNGRKNNNVKAKCTYCGMNGHTVDRCYKKHGYPPGWVQGFKSKGKQQGTAASVNNPNDLGISPEQLHKLFSSFLQTQPGQASGSSSSNNPPGSHVTAATALIPKFEKSCSPEGVHDSRESWSDSWFS
ncbi:PREDICTED: uncharacterized protein LOC109187063 [Ipomoea nil]|uniref:uncharacterized protein LOC109187063 n=1 Tax=Ipomoea nil TaxID=35883 RepID=UPI000900E727|nr:PREDICTED: uncharacterized protein LOC109187063 [Ipomoea nil]